MLAYKEVTIPSGDFDKVNPENILVKSHDNSGSNNALAAFAADMQHSIEEVQPDTGASVDNSSYQVKKKPPPMPKPYSKSRDNDGHDGRKKPPPIPKPYGCHKDVHEESSQPAPGMYMSLV